MNELAVLELGREATWVMLLVAGPVLLIVAPWSASPSRCCRR